MTTSPTGKIGYIEIPITTAKPPHYRRKNLKTSIHSVVHSYRLEISEPKK